MMLPGKIQKLDEIVINRIAAGEVIQRPANALKELLENSLDAGAENISVVVKSGGLKLLQIQDDGTGIREEDLPIVCERFTTSKLRAYEDLQSIGTYGFRGEALASISHVAHLKIITKTENSPVANVAEYCDGRLKCSKKQAGRRGTTIVVEDLFYNMETRKRALKNPQDEHNRICDVVMKYAIHNYKVGFSFKKFEATTMDVKTLPNSTVLDNIRVLYGQVVASELMQVSCEDATTKFSMSGYISNVNYSLKKTGFILFINNRLVDSSALRKAVEAIYLNYLPKGTHPFVYMRLELDPANVDVNVHPTKHEVHFLHEDTITSIITAAVENVLLGANESRSFLVQSLLPGAGISTASVSTSKKREGDDPRYLVRTDPKIQKLDRFLCSTINPDVELKSFNDSPSKLCAPDETVQRLFSANNSAHVSDNLAGSQTKRPISALTVATTASSETVRRRNIRLRSVQTMKELVISECHEGLIDVFRNITYVGCVDRNLVLFQHEITLYVCDLYRISVEFFFQKLIKDFGNFGRIKIEDSIKIKELAAVALDVEGNEWWDGIEDKEKIIENTHTLLISKRKMLDDYFSLTFSADGDVTSIPLILQDYFPDMEGLASYIMNLAQKVDWKEERECFQTFIQCTALFYAVPPGIEGSNDELTLNGKSWKWTIENILFPALKTEFLPPKPFAEDATIVQLTTLNQLYKVFERC